MSWFKPKSFLGVDIGAGGVKVVELQVEKKRPVLFTYGYTSESQNIHQLFTNGSQGLPEEAHSEVRGAAAMNPLTEHVEKYAAVIKQVCKEAKTTSTLAMVSLPVSVLFHTIVTVPVVKPDELDRLLKAEIKKFLPYPLEETALDYELLPPVSSDARVQQAVVNAVPKKLVSFYTAVFQAAGLKLMALESESTALTRSLIGRDTALSMIVDMGAERTNFFIVDNVHTITHQSIEIGGNTINRLLQAEWGVGEDLIEQMKFDLFYRLITEPDTGILSRDEFLTMFNAILDPLVKEIEYSFSLYLEQSANQGKRPEKIIVTGGASFFPFLTSYLADKFKVKCYIGDPWGRIVYQEGLKSLLGQIGPRMSVALGLALRGMS